MLSRRILIGGIYGEKQVYLFPLYLAISNDFVVKGISLHAVLNLAVMHHLATSRSPMVDGCQTQMDGS